MSMSSTSENLSMPHPRAFVVIRQDDRTWVAELPFGQSIDIGASKNTHIRIDNADLAPVHGHFFWEGERLLLRTVNSRVNIFLNAKALSGTSELMGGDEISMGTVKLVVGLSTSARSGVRRMLSHGEFRERLWEESSRAARGGGNVALVMVHAPKGQRDHIAEAAVQSFRVGDIVGEYGPNDLEFLLPDTERSVARAVVERLFSKTGISAAAGLAMAPHDSASPERLLRIARDALSSAQRSQQGRSESQAPKGLSSFIADDALSQQVLNQSKTLLQQRLPILFVGEAGSGKQHLSSYLHEHQEGSNEEAVARVQCSTQGNLEHTWDKLEQSIVQVGEGTCILQNIAELDASLQQRLASRLTSASCRIIATSDRPLDS